jgi:nitroreductase
MLALVTKMLRKVRQIRQYASERVPDDALQQLLEVARWTGSSRNSQPWHFLVVTDRNKLKQVSDLRPNINWVAAAPLAIAIVLDGESELSESYDEGRVTERLLIAATMLGLGGGTAHFGTSEHQDRAKKILGIPAERAARSLVTIGRPTSVRDPRPNPRKGGRKPLTEIVSYERWGRVTPGSP